MSEKTPKWSGKSKGFPLGYRIFIFVIRNLGVRAAYLVLGFVVPWYVLTSWKSNKALGVYFARLRAIVPGIKGLNYFRSYMAMGRNIIDKVAVQAGLEARYTWEKVNGQGVADLIGAHKGGLLLSAHVGNWEFASHFLKGHPGKVNIVLLTAEDERIKAVMENELSPASFNMIPLSKDMSHVFKMNNALMDGEVLCMHGDRNLPGSRVYTADFLGAPAEFPAGPFALAAAHKVPVCIPFVIRTGPMKYSFFGSDQIPPGTSRDEIFKRYVQEFEAIVKKYPLQWFNYYDFWQHADPTSDR
ncbi:MAG: lipid A biosynthesis acyltransferase [Flavobacteriales bacterium]|nr:lipid A biosynthesis acyltransferase [Flavobacteriales bacterium]MBK6943470.1 lipid A biosynthesis acyltransferase [Flavobacteriales bacterium]MBK7240643.1 lipid A biosynthesis acyltransferase [Flavobacteriales bacterium]MBK9535993.1 lipid A biosynthesis acyltransferase [Flavobacteriales bacterium]MBP9139988.1 lipid A biosynthesis acyltransferase [Flavobacteriales bacterium]